MPKVCVLGPINDEAREALLKLLADAGCEVVDDEDPVAEPDCGEDDGKCADPDVPEDVEPALEDGVASTGAAGTQDEDVGVVLLSPECLADEALPEVMRRAAASGRRVIGIWPAGTQDERLPGAFEDYGGDTVPWDAKSLQGAVLRKKVRPEWLKPDAQPRAEREVRRNKC